ncbi:hypothetical protein [Micromonospora cathayae]|uniref:DNA binding domain-containing protein, excisionase family n=1 Tax=Micromonospora cathayae TaxID=3028804 RepID=A0ABY7ZWM6_9ACTN|nr:hypothetical protein [Micromonospora sp. HUAS 3]WDZ87226.1 hypothetical protein PVK37_12860 [Micromonospora sp. HUAS 3]
MARTAKPQTAPPSTGGPLMDDAGLAHRLGVPVGWVEAKAKASEIPCTFIGKHRRYTEEHFQQIVAAGERPARNNRRAA